MKFSILVATYWLLVLSSSFLFYNSIPKIYLTLFIIGIIIHLSIDIIVYIKKVEEDKNFVLLFKLLIAFIICLNILKNFQAN